MYKDFYFFNCCLEGRQLELGETGFLAAKEVVRAICDADFRNNGSYLKDPSTNASYYHEYAKKPKDGLYLMRAVKAEDGTCLDVLIDTRLFPSFVLVEKNNDRLQMSEDVVKAVERSLNHAANKFGWQAKLKENQLNVVQHLDLFYSAMAYVKDPKMRADFKSVVIAEKIADDVMKLLDIYTKGKKLPKAIICPFRAAMDAGAIGKLTKTVFKKTYGNILGNSISALDKYLSDDYCWNEKDSVYSEMKEEFKKLVEKAK